MSVAATVTILVLLVAGLASLVAAVAVRLYLDMARAWDEWERHEAERFREWRKDQNGR